MCRDGNRAAQCGMRMQLQCAGAGLQRVIALPPAQLGRLLCRPGSAEHNSLPIHVLQGTSSWIINATSWTGRPDAWTAYECQKSRPVELQDGEVVLLEAAHCQSPSGPSLLQVRTQPHVCIVQHGVLPGPVTVLA